MLPQPIQHHIDTSVPDMDLRLSDRGFHRFTQLSTDQMAKEIRREISEQALTPVHILQAPLRIIDWCHTQKLLITLVPLVRQILNRQTLFKQSKLEIHADQNMQSVAELISFHAIATGCHGIHLPPKIMR